MPAPFLPSMFFLQKRGYEVVISGEHLNLYLKDYLIANTDWDGLSKTHFDVVLDNSVLIGCVMHYIFREDNYQTVPSFIWADVPSGTTLNLTVSPGARVVGGGGGGQSGGGSGHGRAGGTAMIIGAPTTINNQGLIGGGGGGGALIQAVYGRNWQGNGGDGVRAGGGSGAGHVPSTLHGSPLPTLYTGGGGINGGSDGGDLGQPGDDKLPYRGGRAGYYVEGTDLVTWVNQGDLRGLSSPTIVSRYI